MIAVGCFTKYTKCKFNKKVSCPIQDLCFSQQSLKIAGVPIDHLVGLANSFELDYYPKSLYTQVPVPNTNWTAIFEIGLQSIGD